MITLKHFLTALLLLLALGACSSTVDTTLPVISLVNATYVGNSTAIITWTTDEAATSQVEYGTTNAYGSTTTLDKTYTKSHGVELADLDPDTTYYFRVISKDTSGNESISAGDTFLTENEEISAMAKNGDTVKVHYTLSLSDGIIYQSSVGGDPFSFTIGSGSAIPGFEQAVISMQVGQSKTVTIPAEYAYGLLEYVVNRDQIPADMELEVGQQVRYNTYNNRYIVCTVTDISETTVTLRNTANLAGEDLTFEIELVEIL